jgi:hypothetical protein
MRVDLPASVICASIAVAALAPSPASSQEAPPVAVRFSFESPPSVSNLFRTPEQRSAAEADLSRSLAEFFAKRLPYWPAQPGTESQFPQLTLGLDSDHEKWFIPVRLVVGSEQPETYQERVILFGRGELGRLGGFPAISRLPALIQDRVEAHYREAAPLADLVDHLGGCAPLGRSAHLSAADIAILPLRWERYCNLASSVFALEYRDPNGDRVILLAKGTGSPAPFTPDRPDFQGLKASLEHEADTASLTPRFFRLEQIEPDPAACIDIGGLPPAVAP